MYQSVVNLCGLVACICSFLLNNLGSSEGKNSFDDFLICGRRYCAELMVDFVQDLENILTEIWKFSYFSDFPIICILRYVEHNRVGKKHILP